MIGNVGHGGSAVAGGSAGYDAFISYSHVLDGAQTGLERFAEPWYRPRALRVFPSGPGAGR